MSYSREVSGSEKHFIAYNQLRPPFVIQLAVEGEGEPEPEKLFDALERCTAANPGSRLHFSKQGDQEVWVEGPEPTLTVVDAPDFDGLSQENAPFYVWPMNAMTGPTAELVFVRAKNTNMLVFRALHAVMDGRGTTNWAEDFLRCLRGEEPIGHPSDLSTDAFLRAEAKGARPVAPPDATHPYGPAKTEFKGGYSWRRVHVDRPLDSNIVGRLGVALAKKARSSDQSLKVRLNIPTDLRHYRPDVRTTGNFFSSLYVDVSPETTAEGIGLQLIRSLYKGGGKESFGSLNENESGPLAVHRVRTLWDLAHVHDTNLYPFSATISHLGQLESAAFSGPDFKATSAYFVPLVGDTGCVLALNGFDQHVEVACGLADCFTPHGEIDHFADLVRQAVAGD